MFRFHLNLFLDDETYSHMADNRAQHSYLKPVNHLIETSIDD